MKEHWFRKKLENRLMKVREVAGTWKRKALMAAMTIGTAMSTITMSAHASNAASDGINTLVNIATGIVTGIGAFVVLWGIFEFGNAMQSQDGSQQGAAGKRIAGGIVMVVAPQLLRLFT